jgi:hypothetical protein
MYKLNQWSTEDGEGIEGGVGGRERGKGEGGEEEEKEEETQQARFPDNKIRKHCRYTSMPRDRTVSFHIVG